MAKYNLNDQMKIKLNKAGKARLAGHYAKFALKPPKLEADVWEGSLWEFAQIFGEVLYNGCQLPFKSTEFELKRMV